MIVNTGLRRLTTRGSGSGANAASLDFDFVNSPSLVGNRGGTATLVRATTATYTDQDLIVRTALASQARMQGMRVVSNLCPTPSTTIAVAGNKTITASVGTYVFSMGAEVTGTSLITFTGTATGSTGTLTANASSRTSKTLTITVAGTIIATCTVAAANNIQFENVTGQSNQKPGEYQSVGVLSAPYQGLGVDGAQAYTTLNGNTVSSNVVTEATGASIATDGDWGALPGVAGSYFSTPDSAANSITGSIDIRLLLAMDDWTPAANQRLIIKGGAGGRMLDLSMNPAGTLNYTDSLNGLSNKNSTVATGFADGTKGWVRVTRSASTGDVTFYTSQDGSTWTQLGAVVTGIIGSNTDTADSLLLGIFYDGASVPLPGKIYRAQIYNGINGTLAVDFNPNSYSTGSTWTSTATGEVWTINGNASVQGPSNQGFLVEPAATNLILQSNALTTTWTQRASPTTTQDVIGPDGSISAWTLTDNAAISEGIFQSYSLTAAAYTLSVFVKKTTGAQASYPVILNYNGSSAGMSAITVDTSNGVATVWTAYTGFAMAPSASATCVSFNADYWRVALTRTATAVAYTADIYPAGTTNATQSTGVVDATAQGSAVFYGFQDELGSVATSYIPTTTVAVTRNADVATLATGSWLNATAGSVYAEWLNPSVSGTYTAVSINDTTANEAINIQATTITTANGNVIDGGVSQSALSAVSITGGATAKAITVYSANDFAAYANNTSLGTDAAGTLPTVTRIEIGGQAGAAQINSTIRRISYYPRRLSNVVAQGLTT